MIEEAMAKKGLTKSATANECGVNYKALYCALRGQNFPRVSFVKKLSEVLGLPFIDVLTEFGMRWENKRYETKRRGRKP